MQLKTWLSKALLLASFTKLAISSVIIHGSSSLSTSGAEDSNATPTPSSSTDTQSSTAIDSFLIDDATNDNPLNTTISTTCIEALEALPGSSIPNPSGLLACYNMLSFSNTASLFQADLRLYTASTISPTGAFVNVSTGSLSVSLVYPACTTYNVLANPNRKRQSNPSTQNMTLVQDFSLNGSISPDIHPDKLNSTEILSLLIPRISLQAVSPLNNGVLLQTQLAPAYTAYFTTSAFSNTTRDEALLAATSQMTDQAQNRGVAFVMPGRSLGIFPTSLCVTGAWAVLFVGFFGLGTLGRIRARGVYRAQLANSGPRDSKC